MAFSQKIGLIFTLLSSASALHFMWILMCRADLIMYFTFLNDEDSGLHKWSISMWFIIRVSESPGTNPSRSSWSSHWQRPENMDSLYIQSRDKNDAINKNISRGNISNFDACGTLAVLHRLRGDKTDTKSLISDVGRIDALTCWSTVIAYLTDRWSIRIERRMSTSSRKNNISDKNLAQCQYMCKYG